MEDRTRQQLRFTGEKRNSETRVEMGIVYQAISEYTEICL